MTVPADQKFSGFVDGGDLQHDDIVVGLRNGVNTRFSYQGDPGLYLPLAGGTMAGAILMDGNAISDLPAPTNPSDAATKAYVDATAGAYLPLAGGTMSGAINMGANFIHAVTDPVAAQDAATKAYVDATTGAYLPLAGGTMTGDIIFATGKGLKSGTTAANTLLLQGYNTNTLAYVAMGTITAGNPPTFDLNTTTTIGGAYIYRVGGIDVAVADGGTGVSTLTNHGILLGQGTSPVSALTLTNNQIVVGATGADPTASTLTALMDSVFGNAQGDILYRNATVWTVLAPGTTGQFLQTQGAAANPQWVTSATVTPAALTKVDDTNVTLTLGGTPSTALLQATSITAGWTGQLSVDRGGTGLAAITAHYLPIGNGTGALTLLAPSATSGIPLVSQGAAADPAYSTAVVAGGGTGNTTFTAYSLICAGTTATGAFQNVSGVGTLNQVLVSQGAGALPIWSSVPGVTPAALTKVDDTNVTLTLGGTPSTALLQATSITAGWTGTLAVSRGGTGAGTLTGLITGNGTSAFTGTAITQYNVLTGGASNLPNSVAPSATSGVPLISQGSSAQPVFGTAVVAGGGTGLTSATAYAVLCGGTTSTGAFQSVSGVGTTGQVLTSAGAGALPTWQTNPSSGVVSVNTQAITATGAFTYTPTTGTLYAIFELQAGGGGSGGTTGGGGQSCCGGGGAGGAYMRILVSGSSNLAAITGSVGIAGTAGSSGNNAGGAGGNTTLVINGGSTWTATGGAGGLGNTASATAKISPATVTGGGFTTGTNGTLIIGIKGQNGGSGFSSGASITQYVEPAGGDSFLGHGGGSSAASLNNTGVNYGGGAGGFINATGSNSAGLAGGQGIVIVTEFCSV